MINASICRQAVKLINEAVDVGGILFKVCNELGISQRIYNCWKNTNSNYTS